MSSVVHDAFGQILTASQIEAQVKASLKKWFPTYLREIESQLGLPKATFAPPRNYSDRNSFDAEAGEELPKVVVIAPGTIGTPTKDGNGIYSAVWRLGIGIAAGAKTEDRANMVVKAYGAAIRGIMLQSSELDTIGAVDITWTDESYDDLPIPDIVQLVKAASLYFNVSIQNVVTRGGGPALPDQAADSYDYPEFETVII
jgi:hypothetical protein